jgi:hypothetical protein
MKPLVLNNVYVSDEKLKVDVSSDVFSMLYLVDFNLVGMKQFSGLCSHIGEEVMRCGIEYGEVTADAIWVIQFYSGNVIGILLNE